MPTNYTIVIAKIKAMLTALQADGENVFGEVHDFGEGKFESYPAAVILDRAGTGQVLDTARNERDFIFRIMLYQEQSAAGKTKAEAAANMRACVDAVMEMFDKNINLDSVVSRVRVVPVNFDFTSRTGTYNFATFDVSAVDLVNNF